ncbi:MAG: hypothetical protein MHM6MM_000987 [Cercozoa sp. M6MM]
MLDKLSKKPLCDGSMHDSETCGQSTLHVALASLQNNSINERAQRAEFAQSLNTDILEPLQVLRTTYARVLKQFQNTFKKLEKDLRQQRQRTTKLANKLRSVRNDLRVQVEARERLRDPNLVGVTQQQVIKAESRLASAQKTAEDYERRYAEQCDAMRRQELVFREGVVETLTALQQNEATRVVHMREALRKWLVYESSVTANRQFELNGLAPIMEAVSADEDLLRIQKVVTAASPTPPPAEEDSATLVPQQQVAEPLSPSLSSEESQSEPTVSSPDNEDEDKNVNKHEELQQQQLRQQQQLEEEKRQEQQRLEQERLERERVEQERLEQERLEQERLEQERIERERRELEEKKQREEEERRLREEEERRLREEEERRLREEEERRRRAAQSRAKQQSILAGLVDEASTSSSSLLTPSSGESSGSSNRKSSLFE